MKHGDTAYKTKGCRCAVCTEDHRAKAQAFRRRNREAAAGGMVEGITHGVYGYEGRGCRCAVCTHAKSTKSKRDKYRKVQRERGLTPPL